MGFPKIEFRISEVSDCPLYKWGDVFQLSGIAITMHNDQDNSFICTTVVHAPPERKSCKILYGDLNRVIIKYERADQIPDCLLSCSGCTGSIRLEHTNVKNVDAENESTSNQIGSILHLLSNFSFFKNIDKKEFKEIIKYFKLKTYPKDSIIMRKGDPGGFFYIVTEGQIEILNDAGIPITSLHRGEVFGEMSLISEDNVGATAQASRQSRLLFIDHKHFRKLLEKQPGLQMYFARLLAKRLTASNKVRNDDYASGMIGKLEEIPAEALFQTLNANNKTGILTITQLQKGTARFSMRQGALIKASYGGNKGETAFYEVLREKKGRFKFTPGLPPEDLDVPEIGYFMKLLMQGLQKVDEQNTPKPN
ncbi:cyclic nucleotide-binding domain-containing protein [Desulfogranum japonicum]|uniref:cyclic nucleotide-binding domain-containing protein n=1 Tax=Desulfogranum japonicum TaxID=231447 RepID=UPI00048BDDFB|nr:cyclic nucleotide-binding domain-containing protein [Desulfogranum japonicum]